ncbi:MAG: hypothetical protein AAB481_01285 [Patescibacteria group bacterium]
MPKEGTDEAAAQGNLADIAKRIVTEESYVLGGVLGDEVKRLGKKPKYILPFSEAAKLVPHLDIVELLPFQSPAFRLTRRGDDFSCQAQYTSSSAITDVFPRFGPENLFNSSTSDLRSRYLLAMARIHAPQLQNEGNINNFLIGTHDGTNTRPGIMLLRIPTRNKAVIGFPSGEFATARAKGAPLIITTDTPEVVDDIATYIGEYRANGLNALLAILLSKQLTPKIEDLRENQNSTAVGGRYNLFYCYGQNFDALRGNGSVLDATVDLVPVNTGGFKFEKA